MARKPDISCWLTPSPILDWRYVATFGEVKNHGRRDNEKLSFIETASKVTCLLHTQDGHHSIPCICILGSHIYLTVFDHGGSISTCGYDIHGNPLHFLCILISITSAPHHILRF